MTSKGKRKSAAVFAVLVCLAQTIECYRLTTSDGDNAQKDAGAAKTNRVREGKIVFGKSLGKALNTDISGAKQLASNASTDDDATFQADSAGWYMGQTHDAISKEAAWKRMAASLQCGGEQLRFKVMGPGASSFSVEQANDSPMPLSHVPSTCGYNMLKNALSLVMVVPYTGCNVQQEAGHYVLPMRWQGSPLSLWCPKPTTTTTAVPQTQAPETTTAVPQTQAPETTQKPQSDPEIPKLPWKPYYLSQMPWNLPYPPFQVPQVQAGLRSEPATTAAPTTQMPTTTQKPQLDPMVHRVPQLHYPPFPQVPLIPWDPSYHQFPQFQVPQIPVKATSQPTETTAPTTQKPTTTQEAATTQKPQLDPVVPQVPQIHYPPFPQVPLFHWNPSYHQFQVPVNPPSQPTETAPTTQMPTTQMPTTTQKPSDPVVPQEPQIYPQFPQVPIFPWNPAYHQFSQFQGPQVWAPPESQPAATAAPQTQTPTTTALPTTQKPPADPMVSQVPQIHYPPFPQVPLIPWNPSYHQFPQFPVPQLPVNTPTQMPTTKTTQMPTTKTTQMPTTTQKPSDPQVPQIPWNLQPFLPFQWNPSYHQFPQFPVPQIPVNTPTQMPTTKTTQMPTTTQKPQSDPNIPQLSQIPYPQFPQVPLIPWNPSYYQFQRPASPPLQLTTTAAPQTQMPTTTQTPTTQKPSVTHKPFDPKTHPVMPMPWNQPPYPPVHMVPLPAFPLPFPQPFYFPHPMSFPASPAADPTITQTTSAATTPVTTTLATTTEKPKFRLPNFPPYSSSLSPYWHNVPQFMNIFKRHSAKPAS